MNFKILNKIGIFLMVMSISSSFADSPQKGIFPYPFEEVILENGLTVVMIPMKNTGLVAYYSIVRTGSRDEVEPGHSGFAHFFEHMMFRGTKKYPGPVYDQKLTEMGANANAFTSNDVTCYHLTFAPEDLEKVIELESDRFQNLSYQEAEFKTEAGAILGEYLKGLSSPWMILEETLCATAFEKHPYRHTTIGFKEDIEAMPTMYEYSQWFFKRYYRPDNGVLLLVGDFEVPRALQLIKTYYGNWEKGYVAPSIPQEPEQRETRRKEAIFNGKTLPILCVAYKSPAFSPQEIEVPAFELAGELLFGETSDFHKKLVLKEQRLEALYVDFNTLRDPYVGSITALVKQLSDVPEIEKEIERTIALAKTQGIDPQKLEHLKSNEKYGFIMDLDTPEHVAQSLVRFLSLTGTMESVNTWYKTMEKVSPKEIQSVIEKYLSPQKKTVVLIKGKTP